MARCSFDVGWGMVTFYSEESSTVMLKTESIFFNVNVRGLQMYKPKCLSEGALRQKTSNPGNRLICAVPNNGYRQQMSTSSKRVLM